MKTVISLLFIFYITTISAHEHSVLCGGLETGVNPCRECDSGNPVLFGSDPQYKSSPGYGLQPSPLNFGPPPSLNFGSPSSDNGAPGYKKIVLASSPGNKVMCSGPGCGGIGPIIQNTPGRNLGGIGTGGIGIGGVLPADPNAKAMKMFQPIGDLCSLRKGLSKFSSTHSIKGKKMIVKPARPSKIPCKTDKANLSPFGAGFIGYNQNNFQNQKFTSALKNVMNKVTHTNIFNGHSVKGTSKFPLFNGDTTAYGNIINKISSNNLIPSGSDSVKNIFSQGNNVFSTNNVNTVTSSTNSASSNLVNGLTMLLTGGQSNNYAVNQENTRNTGLKAELLIPAAYTKNTPNGQLNNGQLNNGQSNNGQFFINGQSSNGQFTNTQSSNNQFFTTQSTNGQFNNGQATNVQFNNGQSTNVQFSKGQFNNGQFSNGQFNNGQFSNGQFNNGQFNNGQLNNGQFNNGQFNNGQSKESQSKPPAIVNFIDPSSGNIRAMTREEFCDDKKLSFEDQEKIYKGEQLSGGGEKPVPVDPVSWQIYINELMSSLINSKTFNPPKTILEENLTYGNMQPPVNEYKKLTKPDIPEEVLHTADKPPLEFKNPVPANIDPQSLLNQLPIGPKPREPPKNEFIPSCPSSQGLPPDDNPVSPDDVPCGVIGPTRPDYRPGAIVPADGNGDYGSGTGNGGYGSVDISEYNVGNYQATEHNYGQSIINSGYSYGHQTNGGNSDPNHQHSLTCTCV